MYVGLIFCPSQQRFESLALASYILGSMHTWLVFHCNCANMFFDVHIKGLLLMQVCASHKTRHPWL